MTVARLLKVIQIVGAWNIQTKRDGQLSCVHDITNECISVCCSFSGVPDNPASYSIMHQ